jgi:thiosulfate reductase cytochrome b subunit
MTTIETPLPHAPSFGAEARTERRLIRRTAAWVRVWHWINALSLFFLLASGLQIFNAHPALYWGQASAFTHPLAAVRGLHTPMGLKGVTFVLGRPFPTTGFLGASKTAGRWVSQGFPGWLTIPSVRDLASGRRWHFFFAWIFAVNGGLYLGYMVLSRHLRGDLWPSWSELKDVPRSIVDHLKFKHPKGWAAARYNVLQKLAYLIVLLVLLPLMLLTGLTMSPGMDAALPGLLVVFGGRQSARTLHFIVAGSLVGFFAIHIFQVFAAGAVNEMRSIITGRFVIHVPAAGLDPEPASEESAS